MTDDYYSDRIAETLQCRDSHDIPKVAGAGSLVTIDGCRYQIMHNGVYVLAGGYYGDWTIELIEKLRGHHEPQEEWAFHQVLKTMKPGARMLELGCYWAYYSAWIQKAVPESKLYLIEPILHRLEVGQRTLAVNECEAGIYHAAVGESSQAAVDFETGEERAESIPQISVDDFLARETIDYLDILHADIQGFELRMLRGAGKSLQDGRIGYVFLSTHRNLEDGLRLDLHEACKSLLGDFGYQILVEHTPEESYSVDGLIVAHHPTVTTPREITISRKPAAT